VVRLSRNSQRQEPGAAAEKKEAKIKREFKVAFDSRSYKATANASYEKAL